MTSKNTEKLMNGKQLVHKTIAGIFVTSALGMDQ